MKKNILVLGMFLFLSIASKAQETKSGTAAKSTPAAPSAPATPAKPAENPNQSEFKFEKEVYDFGAIKQGDVVNYEFKFTNVGKEPLIITEAHGSCGCTVPEYPKEPIKAGGKGVIKVTFNSAGKSSMQDKTVTISSNAKGGPKVLHIKGNVEVKAAETTPAPAPEKK
jgi:hypothetical protein